MRHTWNDGHGDRIGEAVAGLAAIALAFALLTWPLALDRPPKGSRGGCCNATERTR